MLLLAFRWFLLLLLQLFGLCLFLQFVELGLLLIDFFLSPVLKRLLCLPKLLNFVLLALIFLILFPFVVFLGFVGPLVNIIEVGVRKLLNLFALAGLDHLIELFACFNGLFIAVQLAVLIVLGALLDFRLFLSRLLLQVFRLGALIGRLGFLIQLQLLPQGLHLRLHFFVLLASYMIVELALLFEGLFAHLAAELLLDHLFEVAAHLRLFLLPPVEFG